MIRDWCKNLDYGRNLPVVGLLNGKIVGVATLHQQLGGWKRHIGPRERCWCIPRFAAAAWPRALILGNPRHRPAAPAAAGKVEGRNSSANRKPRCRCSRCWVSAGSCCWEDYVKDMQAISHDYVLMGLDLKTDEEYASASG